MLLFSNLPIHTYTPITERKTHTQKQVLQSSRSWTNFTNSNRIPSGFWQLITQFSHGSNKIYLFLTTKTNGNITLGITSAWLRVQSVDSPMLHVVVRPKTHHSWTPLTLWLYPLYCFDPALNTSYPGRLDSTHSAVLTQPKIHHPLDTLDSTYCTVSTQHRKHHTLDTTDSTRCTVSTQPKYIILGHRWLYPLYCCSPAPSSWQPVSVPALCLPPAWSSRRQPARCLGQTAEGPCTARTGYGALPTALAGSSSHSPEPTAGQKMAHVRNFLSSFFI